MLTIEEETVEDGRLAVSAASALPLQRSASSAQRLVSTGGGFRSATPQLQHVRLATPVQALQMEPERKFDLGVMGSQIAKAPPPGILQNTYDVTPLIVPAPVATFGGLLPSRSPSKGGQATASPDFVLQTPGDKKALKNIMRRKRERARKQKVVFSGVDGHAGVQQLLIPAPAIYMPAYLPKARTRAQLRQGGPGADFRSAGGVLGAQDESDGELNGRCG